MKKILQLTLFLAISNLAIAQTSGKTTQTRDLNAFTSVELQMAATVYITQGNNFNVQVSSREDLLDKIITSVDDNSLKIYTNQKDWWKMKADVIVYITMPKPNQLHVYGSGSINVQNNLTTDYLSLEVHGSGMIKTLDYKASKAEANVYGSGVIKQQNIIADGLVENIEGSGMIESVSISARSASLNLEGSGVIKSGNITSVNLETAGAGSGYIEIKKGMVQNIIMETAGSGNIAASELAGQTVSAKVTGSGNISITVVDGLNAEVAGSGSVKYKGSPAKISKSVNGSGTVSQMKP
ncbi:MAG: DUF2807 domain-containing protein [Chitinophagales bacterium]|nr:DUF2807 domain-containing protein [Chitinophagales bacterium]